jgi:acetyl esterase/lipase
MQMPPTFQALFNDIAQDWEYALHHPSLDDYGRKQWRDVAYATPVGFRPLMLDVTLPKGDGPHPLVVFIHGGAWLSGHPTVSNPTYRRIDYENKLLEAGYALSRIAYRLSGEGSFPMQLHDCKSAIRFLRNHAAHFNVNPQKFVAMGDSAGGHLASLVGLTFDNAELEGSVGEKQGSSAVQAVVNWFGPTELLTMEQNSIGRELGSKNAADSAESRLIGGTLQEHKSKANAASPLTYVSSTAPPFLLQYGTADRLVPFQQGEVLAEALRKAGCDVTFSEIAGADHCFWGADFAPIVQQVVSFLHAKL